MNLANRHRKFGQSKPVSVPFPGEAKSMLPKHTVSKAVGAGLDQCRLLMGQLTKAQLDSLACQYLRHMVFILG